jgi:hypothetical protein
VPFRFFLDELLFEKFKVHEIAGGLMIQKRMQKNMKSMTGDGRRWRRSSTIKDIDGGVQDMKPRNFILPSNNATSPRLTSISILT